jgi:signal transduction histidine kinase
MDAPSSAQPCRAPDHASCAQAAHCRAPGSAQGGLGIGLNLVQQLVHLHGGEVSAFSTGVAGEGAEFLVHLPLVPPPAG